MTYFTGVPIVGSKVIADTMQTGQTVGWLSTDIEIMIEPLLPEDYDIEAEDGPVSEKHDGKATELRITFSRFHSEFEEDGEPLGGTCMGCLHPADGIRTLFSISQGKLNQDELVLV